MLHWFQKQEQRFLSEFPFGMNGCLLLFLTFGGKSLSIEPNEEGIAIFLALAAFAEGSIFLVLLFYPTCVTLLLTASAVTPP